MLHVTNGDAAAGVMRQAGLSGGILPWRDVLHEGPVPAGLPLEELSEVRARFIAGAGWGDGAGVLAGFRERDRTLAAFREHAEVVLWFEHDLYDQLQLVQLLDWFAGEERGETRLSLVCGAEYLGPSSPARVAERFGERAGVTGAQLALGRAAWNAFRSPDPTAIAALLAEDTGALPWLGRALVRHLEQFPATRSGLSRSERQVLEALADGPATVGGLFLAHARREDPTWLGDSTFAGYVEELAGEEAPLVRFRGADGREMEREVETTRAGREVLSGAKDRIALNGIDRWLGGVHLQGRAVPWRWDADARRLVAGGG